MSVKHHALDNPCPRCDEPISDTAYVCHRCALKLQAKLLTTALLWPALDGVLTRQARRTRTSTATGRTGALGPVCDACDHESCATLGMRDLLAVIRRDRIEREEPPPPHEEPLILDDATSETMWAISNTLTTWARVLIESGVTMQPEVGRAPAVDAAIFLAANADRLAHRAYAEESFDELLHAAREAVSTVDNSPPAAFFGPCGICGRDLYARPGATVVECNPCNWQWNTAPLRQRLLDEARARLLTATEASRILHMGSDGALPASTIRKWAERGRLTAHGSDPRGHPLYRLDDIEALAAMVVRRGA